MMRGVLQPAHDLTTKHKITSFIATLDRRTLEAIIECGSEVLDHADGDPDLEDDDCDCCLAGDEGCGDLTC